MSKILINNGKCWDGEKFFCADILTNGKYIEKIGNSINEKADYVYDASGKIVSAGLVDLHVHLKGISTDKYGIEPHMCSFPFGVTAVNDADSIQGDKTLLESFSVKNTVFVRAEIEQNHTSFSETEKYLEKFGDKAIGIKVYFDKTISEVSDITALKEACDYAKMKKLKVMVHCSNSPTSMTEIVRTLSPGDVLTHAFHGGEHSGIEEDFKAFIIAKEKGVLLDSGFAGNSHVDYKILEKSIKANFLPDIISTDITCTNAYKRGGKYGMTMCMSLAKDLGMKTEDIFKAVTSTPARILEKNEEWGYLKVGRTADIAVFDYANEGYDLTDRAGNRIKSDKGYRCMLTVSDGQIIYKL